MKYIAGLVFAALTLGFVQSVAAQEVVTDEMIANADLTKGKRVYLRCAACHTLAEDGRNKQGPNLWHIFGREAGTKEGQRYSPALASADFVWGADELYTWLTKPKEFLPGTSMAFVGLPKEDQRINVIAYIMSETGYEMPRHDDDDDEYDDDDEHDDDDDDDDHDDDEIEGSD